VETFVVRVWTPAQPERGSPQLRGLVEHVRAGEPRSFDGGRELLSILETVVHERRRTKGEAISTTQGRVPPAAEPAEPH
jgi:hypothetical protein